MQRTNNTTQLQNNWKYEKQDTVEAEAMVLETLFSYKEIPQGLAPCGKEGYVLILQIKSCWLLDLKLFVSFPLFGKFDSRKISFLTDLLPGKSKALIGDSIYPSWANLLHFWHGSGSEIGRGWR